MSELRLHRPKDRSTLLKASGNRPRFYADMQFCREEGFETGVILEHLSYLQDNVFKERMKTCGNFYQSVKKICDYTNLPRTAVTKALNRLKEMGILQTVDYKGRDGATLYWIDYKAWALWCLDHPYKRMDDKDSLVCIV